MKGPERGQQTPCVRVPNPSPAFSCREFCRAGGKPLGKEGVRGLHTALVFCAGGISSLCLGRVSPLRARCLLSRQKFNPRADFNSYTSPFCALHVPRVPAAICPRAAAGAQRGGCVRPVLLLLAATLVTRASSLQRSRYTRHVGPGETRLLFCLVLVLCAVQNGAATFPVGGGGHAVRAAGAGGG